MVLDTGVTNHMSGSQAAFTKLDTMCFGDDSMAQIYGRGTAVFMCKNDESQPLEGVYLGLVKGLDPRVLSQFYSALL
jgi:hypothetical protein